MIDLHCHILPGLDDGARDVEDAVAMAAQAQDDGIELICATPHIRHDHHVTIAELAGRVTTLNGELERRGLTVRVVTGGEVAETSLEGLDPDELALVSLGGAGRWILLEPAPGPLQSSIVERVGALHERGHAVLIAHPERHPGADMLERLTELVLEGALVQATADLLVQDASAPGLLELARRGLVHVLGSDSHSAAIGRPVRLASGLARLGEVESLRPHLSWIAREAPQAIVAGSEVARPFDPLP